MGSGGEVFRELGRTQEVHPDDGMCFKKRIINYATFGPTANPRREMERVAYRRMRNLSRISDQIFTSKISIRNALAKAFGFERGPKTFHR
jgi:hypothetical protein